MARPGAGVQVGAVGAAGRKRQQLCSALRSDSLPKQVAGPRQLLKIARAAWGIENGLHYRRDVTLEEDAGQIRRGGAPQVLAALNHVVVSFLGQAGERNLPDLQ